MRIPELREILTFDTENIRYEENAHAKIKVPVYINPGNTIRDVIQALDNDIEQGHFEYYWEPSVFLRWRSGPQTGPLNLDSGYLDWQRRRDEERGLNIPIAIAIYEGFVQDGTYDLCLYLDPATATKQINTSSLRLKENVILSDHLLPFMEKDLAYRITHYKE